MKYREAKPGLNVNLAMKDIAQNIRLSFLSLVPKVEPQKPRTRISKGARRRGRYKEIPI
ncbi:hypothetical protein HY310_01440 [Candidatus Microgenomates bacterium]|nr:hypothetical protein [Candidatus Microgenomates bacterium]